MHFVREFTPELSIEAKKAEKKAGKKKKKAESISTIRGAKKRRGDNAFFPWRSHFVPRKARERNPLGKGAAAVAN